MASQEVLSAFLDNEPFDADELARVLAEPGGRDLLLDLVALRTLVQDEAAMSPAPAVRLRPRTWVAIGFLAATLIFGVASAILAPSLFTRVPTASNDAPPRPDRVVSFQPGVDWQER